MVAAEVVQNIDTNIPGMEVVQIQADNGETYQAKGPVFGAIFQPNRNQAAGDSSGLTFTAGATLITVNLVGTTTDVTGTLVIFYQG